MTTIQIVILVGTLLVALHTIHKFLIKPVIEVVRRLDQAIDVIMGTSAVVDKRTGTVLVPARPGIMELMSERFNRSEDRMQDIEHRLLTLEDRVEEVSRK